MEQAAILAALADDLRRFPVGLETEIGEIGMRVSAAHAHLQRMLDEM